jgi:hypothetical protein
VALDDAPHDGQADACTREPRTVQADEWLE